VVNGTTLDAATLVSQATFHVVAAGVMMIAALMAMRIFKRERDDGTQAYLLSRPIAREHYLAGKVAGLWLGSAASMLALHGVLCLMIFLNAYAVVPGYLTASLLCSVNLLLVVLAVMALSLCLPEFLAFLAILGVGETKKDAKSGYYRHSLRWMTMEAHAKEVLSKVVPAI
jgi:ABC-type transport system involved in multi-copper enzyme maturation permease subunit